MFSVEKTESAVGLRRRQIKTAVKAAAFLLILFVLFLFFTYMFRHSEGTDRWNILEYYDQPEDSLDVVVVGASSVLYYWDPMRAWDRHGFTSHNYGVTSMDAACYLPAIKDALEKQNPDVLVVETRKFTRGYEKGKVKIGARKLLDAMDWDISRLEAVRHYCKASGISFKDSIPLYLDLMYYHYNHGALASYKSWKWADNRSGNDVSRGWIYKGYEPRVRHISYEDPTENLTNEAKKLNEDTQKLYEEIIAYCREKQVELLFVATPVVITQSESEGFNALAALAKKHDVPYLDVNRFYKEIGFDFARDFQDKHHTNLIGAGKFTDFLSDYLVSHYGLKDRRQNDDPVSAAWNGLYGEYAMKRGWLENDLLGIIAAKDNQKAMAAAQDAYQWLDLSRDSESALLIFSDGKSEHTLSPESKFALNAFGIEEEHMSDGQSFIVVYHDGVQVFLTDTASYKGIVGMDDTKYSISLGEKPEIVIDKVRYFENYNGGIGIAALDFESGRVFDQVVMTVDTEGALNLTHM